MLPEPAVLRRRHLALLLLDTWAHEDRVDAGLLGRLRPSDGVDALLGRARALGLGA